MKAHLLIPLALALAPAPGPRAGIEGQDERPRRPNVLFVMSDQHRWQSMGHTETPELRTPVMDGLAAHGTSFRQAVSNYPLCAPARAILWTSRWPHQTGVVDNPESLPEDVPTIADAFAAAGYATAYIGKWHLGGDDLRPFGFERSIVWSNTSQHWSSGYRHEDGRAGVENGYNATGMTDQALAFLRERSGDTPFLLVVSWNPPHPELSDAPKEERRLYPFGSLPYRDNVDEPWRAKAAFRDYGGYHAHVSAIDDELGRLLAALAVLELERDTIVLYTSDHGTMLGSHDLGTSKRHPYEEAVRVPLLVRWPDVVSAGATRDTLIGLVDVFPTLCGLVGLPVPEGCEGQDLSGALLGRSDATEPDSQFLMHVAQDERSSKGRDIPLWRGLRTQRYTFAVQADGTTLLFDNVADPFQRRNLAEAPETAELRASLADRLARWIEAAEDPFELPASTGG